VSRKGASGGHGHVSAVSPTYDMEALKIDSTCPQQMIGIKSIKRFLKTEEVANIRKKWLEV